MYTAYVLSETDRTRLSLVFPPKYEKFIGHHITTEFGVDKNAELPKEDAFITVVGFADNNDGLEALIVSVDGATKRDCGKTYHITWSLDPERFKPVDSNQLIESGKFTLIRGFVRIYPTPDLLY